MIRILVSTASKARPNLALDGEAWSSHEYFLQLGRNERSTVLGDAFDRLARAKEQGVHKIRELDDRRHTKRKRAEALGSTDGAEPGRLRQKNQELIGAAAPAEDATRARLPPNRPDNVQQKGSEIPDGSGRHEKRTRGGSAGKLVRRLNDRQGYRAAASERHHERRREARSAGTPVTRQDSIQRTGSKDSVSSGRTEERAPVVIRPARVASRDQQSLPRTDSDGSLGAGTTAERHAQSRPAGSPARRQERSLRRVDPQDFTRGGERLVAQGRWTETRSVRTLQTREGPRGPEDSRLATSRGRPSNGGESQGSPAQGTGSGVTMTDWNYYLM